MKDDLRTESIQKTFARLEDAAAKYQATLDDLVATINASEKLILFDLDGADPHDIAALAKDLRKAGVPAIEGPSKIMAGGKAWLRATEAEALKPLAPPPFAPPLLDPSWTWRIR